MITEKDILEKIAKAKAEKDSYALNGYKAKLAILPHFKDEQKRELLAGYVSRLILDGDIIGAVDRLIEFVAYTHEKKPMAYLAKSVLAMRDYVKRLSKAQAAVKKEEETKDD